VNDAEVLLLLIIYPLIEDNIYKLQQIVKHWGQFLTRNIYNPFVVSLFFFSCRTAETDRLGVSVSYRLQSSQVHYNVNNGISPLHCLSQIIRIFPKL